MSGNEVQIVVKAVEKGVEEVLAASGKHVKGLGSSVDQLASKQRKGHDEAEKYGKGLEGAGEKADASEQRIMGARDTIDGLAAIMQGPGQQGISSYLQGWADLASGVANGIVPAMQAFSLANMKALASTVGSKVAMVATSAATKAWTAAQWLLNAALTANPIGLIVVAIAALVGAIILAYKNSETFRKICDAAFKAIGDAVKWLVDKVVAGFKIFWGAIEPVWKWFKKLTGATDDQKKATEDVTTATQNATTSYQDQIDAINTLTDLTLGLADGEMGLYDAVDKATQAAKENGKTLDVHTEKGRNNKRALEDIARQTLAWRKASIDLGESVDRQAAITEQGRSALIKAAIQMGMNKTAAEKYADGILQIPLTRKTTASFSTPNLGAVKRRIDQAFPPRSNMEVYVTTTMSRRVADNDKFTGGIIGAAGGGPRGRLTMVGEQGRELVELPFGSMVHSNPDTERMLSGMGGGGGGIVHLVLQIGERTIGEIVADPIRKIVRVVGNGDVQAAFGSGA